MLQIKWVWKNMRGAKKVYIFALSVGLLSSLLVFVNPMLTQRVVDEVLVGVTQADGTVFHNTEILMPLLIGIVGMHVFRMLCLYGRTFFADYSTQKLTVNLRRHLYDKIQSQDKSYYDRNRTGDLMTRMTGDLEMVRHFMAFVLRELLTDTVLFLVTLVYFFTVDWVMTLCILAVTPLLLWMSKSFSGKVRSKYADLREKLSELNTQAQENISGNRVVKAFAREGYEIEKFSQKNEDYRGANIDAQFTWLRYFPVMNGIASSLTVITYGLGALFIINGQMTAGQLAAFSGLIWAISEPMRNLGMLLNDTQRFFASANKVIEMYYEQPRIVDAADTVDMPERFQGKVEFKDVHFGFGREKVFDGISFTANPGETIAIMGATGSGKTSLVNLLARFYDVTGGQVLVDGVDVRKMKLRDLRHNIGMAPQEVFLFSETVDGNIAYSDPEMSEEEVKSYARIADADGFIKRMEDGYETIVGERGVGLSGGQKQRIALARALAVKPAILVLDDTTSAVDLETEKYIQEQLAAMEGKKCTKFIIAQRISSVKDADQILILADGKIAERGTHQELLRQNGYYREIFELQHGEAMAKEAVLNGAQ
ncbi:MAG: ABC transporter ATP-binding protein [Oscillospiraceae bacterium]|nr:ABC transporter ATP-binding protein [Oscillospiraceae bacterium]